MTPQCKGRKNIAGPAGESICLVITSMLEKGLRLNSTGANTVMVFDQEPSVRPTREEI